METMHTNQKHYDNNTYTMNTTGCRNILIVGIITIAIVISVLLNLLL